MDQQDIGDIAPFIDDTNLDDTPPDRWEALVFLNFKDHVETVATHQFFPTSVDALWGAHFAALSTAAPVGCHIQSGARFLP